MVTTKTTGKTTKNSKSKISKKETVSGVSEKNVSNSETSVSVFTKATTPKVVVQSEKIDTPNVMKNINTYRILKSICIIVLTIIILITFFLSLKTYQTVNELHQLFTF